MNIHTDLRLANRDTLNVLADKQKPELKKLAENWKMMQLSASKFGIIDDDDAFFQHIDKAKIGCTCDEWLESGLCKHVHYLVNVAKRLPTAPAKTDITGALIEAGWEHVSGKGWLCIEELNDGGKPEAKPEPPKEKPIDNALNSGIEVEQKVYEEAAKKPPSAGMKLLSGNCQYCGKEIKRTRPNDLKTAIENHERGCKKKPPSEEVVEESLPTDAPKATDAKNAPVQEPAPKKETPSKPIGVFDAVEELVEFGVAQIFGDTGTGKTAFCRELAEQAADEGKKVIYWDSEGNMTRKQRAAMAEHKNITYVLDRDWDHIKNMMSSDLSKGSPKLTKCDLFILDSIGVPVLGIYGTMKQNQQGSALQAMQGLMYQLTKFAEKNNAVIIVTNQPVSEMNKTKEQIADRHPFGDKAMFFTKEILKIVAGERTEYKTVCHLLAWRSRSAGRNKILGTVTISDNGTEITFDG